MNRSSIEYWNRSPAIARGCRSGVSLHSHTLHSRESAAFVERLARRSWSIRWIVGRLLRRYAAKRDLAEELSRMWWTSPLSPTQAHTVERRQIEEKLDLDPIVSISDHDNIEAPLKLQLVAKNERTPISVEWTVPFGATYFHLGVHNLPPGRAREMMAAMKQHTSDPDEDLLADMLRDLHRRLDTLIILNHPLWDQPWLGSERHKRSLDAFLTRYGPWIHALEINGLRSLRENREVVALSAARDMPLVSGGDRHGCEPNATLNLTSAATFAELAAEVRGGISRVLVMPQYHEPLALRVIQTVWDVLRDHPEHAEERFRWSERVFRRCHDGQVRSLDVLWGGRPPRTVHRLVRCLRWLASPRLRPKLTRPEVVL